MRKEASRNRGQKEKDYKRSKKFHRGSKRFKITSLRFKKVIRSSKWVKEVN